MNHAITDNKGRSFLIGDYIDKGSFSKVYVLKCCSTEKVFAGKFINRSKLQKCGISNKVYDEIKIHQKLRHPNIVQFVSYIERDTHIIIVLEYCSKCSMVSVLHTLKTLTAAEAKYFMIQVVSAVEYLHVNHIVHRDLKLGNLFVNKRLEIKLGDFGLAVLIEYEGQKRFSRCGTPNYLAPEVINGTGHGYEVDVWALGCILYTMLEGTPPFQGKDTSTTYNNILRGSFTISSNINVDAKCIIFNTLQKDLRRRPTVFELAKSTFLVSDEPHPKPPNIDVCDGEVSSPVNKRVKASPRKVSFQLPTRNGEVLNDPYKLFAKLRKYLSNVLFWRETNLGEFLSENVLMKPVVWVNSWIDYTNTYGFAYQLNNTNLGMLFNDDTRMLIENEKQSVYYVKDDASGIFFRTDSVPLPLKKKFSILMTCGQYMSESLQNAHEGENLKDPYDKSVTTELFHWVKGEHEMVMFLTNGSVQVNFTRDHVKFILCGYTKTVTVIERADCMKTLKIEGLQTYGCSIDLKNKLYVISSYIDCLLSK